MAITCIIPNQKGAWNDGITIISGAILVQIVAIIGQCASINGECYMAHSLLLHN